MSVASAKSDSWQVLRNWRAVGNGELDLRWHDRLLYAAASRGARLYSRLIHDTCRWHCEGDDWRQAVTHDRYAVILLSWHNRMPAVWPWCETLSRRDTTIRMITLVSASKDGEFLARPIREQGGIVARGSSSRGGIGALKEVLDFARSGASINTVGDGPRGPRYELKPGPIMMAAATGLPIVPLTWACGRTGQLHRAWDQMMFPLPFSSIHMKFGQPIHVPADADDATIAEYRRMVEARLHELTEWADTETRIVLQIPRPKPGEVLKRRKAGQVADKRR